LNARAVSLKSWKYLPIRADSRATAVPTSFASRPNSRRVAGAGKIQARGFALLPRRLM